MLSLKVFLLQLILDTRIGYLGSFLLYWKFSPDTYYVSGAWCVMSVGILDNDGGVYYNSYGRSSPYLDNANLENCWCVTAEYEEFYGYVGLGDLRHNSYGMWCDWTYKSL